MNLWILLVVLQGGAMQTVEFNSEYDCLMAQLKVSEIENTDTVCIRKGPTK